MAHRHRKGSLLLPLACVLLSTPAPAAADEIYKWTDANGNVHFGNRKPASAPGAVETTQGGLVNESGGAQPERGKSPSSKEELARKQRLRQLQQANRRSESRSVKPLVIGSEPKPKSESECQSVYGKSCSDLENWREQAIAKCQKKNSAHCEDESYIDKQKPKTLEEQEWLKQERIDNRRARYNRAQRDLR